MKILIVEDEKRMVQALCELLKHENYDVDYCEDGLSGQEAIESGIYDLVVLDVMLPHKNGFDIAKAVRRQGLTTPILMLTAKSDIDDKVNGLDCGADDYLTKPFLTKELLARIRALLRRNSNIVDGSLSFGDISLDVHSANLTCSTTGQCVRLSEKENKILEYLMSNSGQVLSREQLALKIWGYENDSEYNNVEVYLSFTRKKLAFVKASTEIKSVRGIGYELRYNNV